MRWLTLHCCLHVCFILALSALLLLPLRVRAVKTDMSFSSGTASIITTMPSFASLCGKLMWGGWPVDRWGPRKTYTGSMVALAGLVLCYTSPSIISSWYAVAALAFAVEFAGEPYLYANVHVTQATKR